jgi:signal transduction histidine kinase/DNA-binding response OmpR family regulator/Tfp pilus assembly protein PilF
MKQPLLLPIFVSFTLLLHAQPRVDSLQLEFRSTTIDSVKIKILLDLFQQYRYDSLHKAEEVALQAIALAQKTKHRRLLAIAYNQYASFLTSQSNPDSAIVVYQKGLEWAERINSNSERQAALTGLGANYLRKGNFKKALDYKDQVVKFAEEIGDQEGIAGAHKGMGDIYLELAEYTKAMESYTMASETFLALNNMKGFAITLANIGLIQWKLENFKSSESYLIRSDSIFKELDFQPGRAFVLNNLGIVYKNGGDLDKSITYYAQALDSYKNMGDLHNVGLTNYNIGNVYLDKEDINTAISYYQKSLDLCIQTNDSLHMSYSYKALGDGYHALGNTTKAKYFLLKAIEVGQTIALEIIAMQAYGSLSELYENEGDFSRAYRSLISYNVLKDSLYTREKRELAADIDAKYQNEQKVKEIELLSSEKNIQTLQLEKRVNERNALIALAFVILLVAGLLYNQFRIKQNVNKKLQEADRVKSNFFANISHEFRTPLTLIKGPIEQLEQTPGKTLSRDNIKMITRNTDRVLTLVNQLLDLSKIDGDSLKLETHEGDLNQFLRAITSSFNSLAVHHNIDYTVKIPATTCWAAFDKDKLEKVVINLLSNAFKFSEDGALVFVDVTHDEGAMDIQVSDTGIGIPPEKLPFIFDRFYQADTSATQEREGSGIGLSLAKNLVELMEGTITVSSEVGKGTFFTVHLPLKRIKSHTHNPSENIPIASNSAGKLFIPGVAPFNLEKSDARNLPEILLVEDNEDMRTYIRSYLIDRYRVTESTDGKAGLQKASDDTPDLIITDLMMPKMDGIELCKRLKSDVHTSHIPVIMLTAKAGTDNKLEGLETGADDYLTKPFDGKELLIRTKNLIEQRQRLRELFSNKDVQIEPKDITVTSVDEKFLKQVLALLEDNFSRADFGVPQMQDGLAMSKTQLHRKLKALTNEAPGELLRNFRLKRAAQLLSKRADSVTQVAYQVGFNNLSYFAKCFKDLYGMAPSSY